MGMGGGAAGPEEDQEVEVASQIDRDDGGGICFVFVFWEAGARGGGE